MSKDEDFAVLVERLGPPPHVIWITCGNTSNAALRGILETGLPTARELIRRGEPLVEISDARVVGRRAARTGPWSARPDTPPSGRSPPRRE